jgi:hypothetical protein
MAVLLGVIGFVVLVAVVMSIFVRRHGEAAGPEPGWTPTAEVFRDPASERLMRVWTDPAGGHHYLPDR